MFSFIIPAYDPTDKLVCTGVLPKLLHDLERLNGEKEIIVVNNNGTEAGSLARFLEDESSIGRIKLVSPGSNKGTAGGFNEGLRVAESTAEYHVFVSNDAQVVDNDMLAKIVTAFRNNPKLGIGHPFSVFEDNDEYNLSHEYGRKRFYRAVKNGVASGEIDLTDLEIESAVNIVARKSGVLYPLPSVPLTFCVISKTVIGCVGSFDEGVRFGCHENNDLCFRALKAGFQVGRINNVFVNHRRMLVRESAISDDSQKRKLPHINEIRQSSDWWMGKYKKNYAELYFEWRFGRLAGIVAAPIFALRRIAINARWKITSLRRVAGRKWKAGNGNQDEMS